MNPKNTQVFACLVLSLFIMIPLAMGTGSEQVLLTPAPQSKQFAIAPLPLPVIGNPPQEPYPESMKEDSLHLNEKNLTPLHKEAFNPTAITQEQFICKQLAKLEASKEILNNPQISKLFQNWWHLYQDSNTLTKQEEFGRKSEEVEKQIRIIIKAGIITGWQNNL